MSVSVRVYVYEYVSASVRMCVGVSVRMCM